MAALERGLPKGVPLPVVDLELMGGEVRVLGFGKPHDWSLRSFNGTVSNASLKDLDVSKFLPPIATSFGLGKMLFAPSPRNFNAEVASESELMKKRYCIESEDYHDSAIWLERGKDADAMILSSGWAYVVSPGGCPVLSIHHKPTKTLGVAHTGMRSTIDEARLKGESPREHESVIFSLIEAMERAGVRHTANLEATILFPIDPTVFTYPWDHSIFGALNRKRTEYLAERWGVESILNYADPIERRLGRPVLSHIIKAQLMSCGVPEGSISTIPSPPPELWHDTRQGNGEHLARNLVIVQHKKPD